MYLSIWKAFLGTEREKEIEEAEKTHTPSHFLIFYFTAANIEQILSKIKHIEKRKEKKMILERFEHAQKKRSASILESDGERKKN